MAEIIFMPSINVFYNLFDLPTLDLRGTVHFKGLIFVLKLNVLC